MPKPYTIRLFMPDGNPNSLKIIDKMNWTGIGLEVSRDSWSKHKNRKEFDQAGIYILFGYTEDSDLPIVYIYNVPTCQDHLTQHSYFTHYATSSNPCC